VGQLNAQVDWTVFVFGKTVNGRSYLDMLELYAISQVPPQTILQQDEAPSHFCYHRVQNGSGPHPVYYAIGYLALFPRKECIRVVKLTNHLHLIPMLRIVEVCL
jgi:hypothetical protein